MRRRASYVQNARPSSAQVRFLTRTSSSRTVLVKLAESVPELNKVALLRSYSVEGNYVMEMEQADAALLRSKPEIKQKLEDTLKGKVWVIGTTNSDRQFLEELFYPIRILTVNTVWLPDGSKLTKVIIPGRRPERLRGEIECPQEGSEPGEGDRADGRVREGSDPQALAEATRRPAVPSVI